MNHSHNDDSLWAHSKFVNHLVEANGADVAELFVSGPYNRPDGRVMGIYGDTWTVESEEADGSRYTLSHPRLVSNWTLRKRTEGDPQVKKGSTLVDGYALPVYFDEDDWRLIGPS